MRSLRSPRRLFAALAVTALVVSACGGSDDASSLPPTLVFMLLQRQFLSGFAISRDK